jgi:hypothetical protein
MATRNEEAICQKAFDGYLRGQLAGISFVWESEPNGEKTPPDFHLHFSRHCYAVEVTTLMTQYEQSAGRPISDLGIWKMTEDLAQEVEDQTLQEGSLRGVYVLTVDGPYDNFLIAKREIKQLLLEFIHETKDQERIEGGTKPRHSPSGHRFFLEKWGTQENRVGIIMHGDGSEWDWKVVEELYFLVASAVTEKAHKLRAIPKPKVLLLLDAHHLATERECQEVGARFSGEGGKAVPISEFHSVYLIGSQAKVFSLYPKDRVTWDV